MNDITAETPVNSFVPGGRRRHRKTKQSSTGVRRAIVLALAVPVTSAALAGPSAFAAEKGVGATAKDTAPGQSLDADDQQMVTNLETRVLDQRLGANVSGVVLDADSDNTLWDHNGATAMMPASNVKLATSTAALTVLGPTTGSPRRSSTATAP
jgi:D-alanyl-D-alanine carboxypeptidase/D-alanyl-D-alanine-endopeptidase (penicillin-binding protein 4)